MARANENIYTITIGEEPVVRRLLEGNPWLVKGYFFSVKFWPISLIGSHYARQGDVLGPISWHTTLTLHQEKCPLAGKKIRAILEVNDPVENGF
ncbi:hypothetical protein ACFX1T_034958 [Malus domestica]